MIYFTPGGRAESHLTDGDVVPVTPQGDDGGFSEAGGAAPDEPTESSSMKDTENQMWMDFEIFCKCFKYVVPTYDPIIYAKPFV